MHTMKDQIKNIAGKIKTKPVQKEERPVKLPATPSSWVGDGVDHINLMMTSASPLGRDLSIRRPFSFLHPVLGSFRSMNNLWYFVRAKTPDDRMKNIDNHGKLMDFVREHGGEIKSVDNFRAVIINSFYLCILSSPKLMHDLINSDLPFDLYRTLEVSNVKERFRRMGWYVEGITVIRAALKKREEPNLKPFLDPQPRKGEVNIYREILSRLSGVPQEDIKSIDLSNHIAKAWERYDKIYNQPAQTEVKRGKAAPTAFVVEDIDNVMVAPPAPVEAAPVVEVEAKVEVTVVAPESALTPEVEMEAEQAEVSSVLPEGEDAPATHSEELLEESTTA